MTTEPATAAAAVLEVRDLTVSFGRGARRAEVVHGVSLRIERGEIVGVVGESGSGKTVTALACADLLPEQADATTSSWTFEGQELGAANRRQRGRALGGRMAVVFQDPMSALNPARRVGAQVIDTALVHAGLSKDAALDAAADRFRRVRIAGPERRLHEYPHAFSGGMRQRAVIAMGLMVTPTLLIADEPTTALDVTVQADVVRLITEINAAEGTAVLFVSHNIALVSEICHRVVVMYAGRIIEELPASELASARHPYTRALIASVPTLATDRSAPLVSIGGQPPDAASLPPGCSFADRCPLVEVRCREAVPELLGSPGHRVACVVAHDPGDAATSQDATA